jgi:hypothetical protein
MSAIILTSPSVVPGYSHRLMAKANPEFNQKIFLPPLGGQGENCRLKSSYFMAKIDNFH